MSDNQFHLNFRTEKRVFHLDFKESEDASPETISIHGRNFSIQGAWCGLLQRTPNLFSRKFSNIEEFRAEVSKIDSEAQVTDLAIETLGFLKASEELSDESVYSTIGGYVGDPAINWCEQHSRGYGPGETEKGEPFSLRATDFGRWLLDRTPIPDELPSCTMSCWEIILLSTQSENVTLSSKKGNLRT